MTLDWFCFRRIRAVRRNCRVRLNFGGATVLSACCGHTVSFNTTVGVGDVLLKDKRTSRHNPHKVINFRSASTLLSISLTFCSCFMLSFALSFNGCSLQNEFFNSGHFENIDFKNWYLAFVNWKISTINSWFFVFYQWSTRWSSPACLGKMLMPCAEPLLRKH